MTEDDSRALSINDVVQLISHGELEVRGLLPGSSNYTFLADVRNDRHTGLTVYKPTQGETPLWDFPHGSLADRELAAYLVDQALGWQLVPPTVLRIGPYGRGAVQYFVEADFRQHFFTFHEDPEVRLSLQKIAAFDIVINNADRKGGHCLLDRRGQIWAIDHGVCFHTQYKLRTVIWDFAGEALPPELIEALVDLRLRLDVGCDLRYVLQELLSVAEIGAMARRIDGLLASGAYPDPDPHRRCYPWPLV